MRRAIGIVRVSQVGGREGDSFASPTIQRERIQAACQREHLELLEILEELDVSGGADLTGRPGLGPALQAVEAGDADVIVAAYFDRFFRSMTVQAQVIERVEAAGGQVLAVDIGVVSHETAAQWLSATMLGMMAEHARRVGKERSGEAQQRAIARGVPPWPHIVPGYERGTDGRLVVTADADVIREAFEMRAAGARITDVREYLRAHGIDRNSHQVSWLLGSRVYLGEIHFGKYTPNLAAHEPIVTHDLFDRVQAVRVPQGRKPRVERLLARLGVLRCATCDARMVISSQHRNGRRYVFYRCPTEDCTQRPTISAPLVEQLVADETRRALEGMEGRASAERDARDADAAVERTQAELDSAIRAFSGLQDEPVALERLQELRDARDVARARAEELRGLSRALVISASADWDTLSLDARRALVRTVVARVTVARGQGAGRVRVELVQ